MYSLLINTLQNPYLCLYHNYNPLIQLKFLQEHSSGEYIAYYLDKLKDAMKEFNLTINNHINQLVVFSGPSLFTAVRVGVIFANTLAFSLNIKRILPIFNNEILFYCGYKQLLKKKDHYQYIITLNDIGKKEGGIISVFDSAGNLLFSPQYIVNTAISKIFSHYLKESCILIKDNSNKFNKLGICDILDINVFNDPIILGNFIKSSNLSQETTNIVPQYIKDPDINVKHMK